jgi:hypothetical protein
MADVLHRRTRELLRSVNTPDYPAVDWIASPDLSAVVGLPAWQWVIEGDTIRPPTAGELAAIEAARLPAAKAERIAQIDAKTAAIVTSGVDVATGSRVSTSLAATQNLQNLVLGVNLGVADLPQDISTVDGGSYTIVNTADMVRVAGVLAVHQRTALNAGRQLRAQVLAATTQAELDAIVDNREVTHGNG